MDAERLRAIADHRVVRWLRDEFPPTRLAFAWMCYRLAAHAQRRGIRPPGDVGPGWDRLMRAEVDDWQRRA